ncbi:MAG: hypothetical protein ALAOOOJD_00745 [bacterium]|nr:hypothetical protein [bacterium]
MSSAGLASTKPSGMSNTNQSSLDHCRLSRRIKCESKSGKMSSTRSVFRPIAKPAVSAAKKYQRQVPRFQIINAKKQESQYQKFDGASTVEKWAIVTNDMETASSSAAM